MKQTTARKLAEAGRKYIEEIVTFPDFHGRRVTGKLEAVGVDATSVLAILKVEGREYGIFANTPVEVAEPTIGPDVAP